MVNPYLHDISDSFPYPKTKLLVTVFNLCVEVLSLLHYLLVCFFVFQNSVIHKNLKIVSYNLWICGVFKSVFNVYIYLSCIFLPNYTSHFLLGNILYSITEVARDGIVLIPSAIVFERMYSIINAKDYENWFSWKFIIIVCGCDWISAIWIMVHLLYLPFIFSIQYTYLIINSILIAVYTLYFGCYFATAKKSVIGLTLSERYQRAQNKAAYSAVRIFAITAALTTIIAILCMVNNVFVLPFYFKDITFDDKAKFQGYIFGMLVGCLHLVLPYGFVCVHPSLKKRYCEFFRFAYFKSSKVVTIEAPAQQIHSVTGQNLQVPNETDFYFKSLTDQWDAKLVRTKGPTVIIG